jgi:phage terminase large subunit-like protein
VTRGPDYVCRWIETHCRLTSGGAAGKPFRLLDWQREVIRGVFEIDRATGLRRRRWAYVSTAKKSGKTELAAAAGLYLLIGDEEPDALVVCAAANEDQADLVFDAAKTMCATSPTLSAITERYDREIVVPSAPGGARLRRVAAVAGANDGMNLHGVICDELHEWTGPKGRSTWDVLTNGIVARKQPLVFQITTAGWDEETICFEQYDYGRKVAAGELEDPSFFFSCREADKGADHRDPAAWQQANPSYGITVNEDAYRDLLSKKSENVFRRYYLNNWTAAEEAWISPAEWDACQGHVEIDAETPVFVAVDFGRTRDSSAVVTAGFIDDNLHVEARIWTPRPDEPVRVLEVERYVSEVAQRRRVMQLAFDRYGFYEAAERLEEEGLLAVVFEQHDRPMAEASTTLFNLIREGRVVHSGDPLLRSHVLAARGVETTSGYRIQKRKIGAKPIDAAVALGMAAQRAITAPVYEVPWLDVV